jgi:heme-degrading monooxygenase HmoA
MEKPYYAVIFTSERTEGDHGYDAMAKQMIELASQQPGFLGVDSVRNERGVGITVSYWDSLEDIEQWKRTRRTKSLKKKESSNGTSAIQSGCAK